MPRFYLLPVLLLAACPNKEKPAIDDSQTSTDDDNSAPAVTLDQPGNGQHYQAGENIDVSGFVADDHDAPESLIVTLESSINGPLTAPIINSDGTFDGQISLAQGNHSINLTITDADGESTLTTVEITIDPPGGQNSPPEAPIVHIDPQAPVTGNTLTLVVDRSFDPDGDVLTTHTQWSVQSVPHTEYNDFMSIDGSNIVVNDRWRVEVWTNDGVFDSPHTSTEVVVANAAPIISSVVIDPSEGTVLSSFNCLAEAADPEGSAVNWSYSWQGNSLGGQINTQQLPAGMAVFGDSITCTATASDGAAASNLVSAALVIGNEAPTAPVLEIQPSLPADTDDIQCLISAPSTDVDGHTISYTYSWTVNGQAYSGSSDTVPAADTHRDEIWECSVIASDAYGGNSPVSTVSVTIGRAWEDQVSASTTAYTIDGMTASGSFGKTIAMVGDTDGDGLSEVLVGASGENSNAGAMYLFSGSSLNGHIDTSNAAFSWQGHYSTGSLGGYRSITAPGDLDGDGLSELLFAASDASANGQTSGIAYLLYGGDPWTGGDPNADAATLILGDLNDVLGVRLSAGDVEGDGFPDLLVAIPKSSDNGRLAGAVGLYYNNGSRFPSSLTTSDADLNIYGDSEQDELGWTSRFVGDVDNDGYDDFVTMTIYGQDAKGVLGLFLGGNLNGSGDLSTQANALFVGDVAGDRLGYDTVGKTDLDSDGIDDLVLGAYLDDQVAADAGSMHIFLGRQVWAGTLTPSNADNSIMGGAAGDRFSHVLASPGDLDSDGVNDIVTGALLAEPNGLTDQGAAWVLLGPDWGSFSSSADVPWMSYGEAATDFYGDALSFGQGDFNGDGHNDFAVGAQLHDAGGNNAGRVYLWSGR